MTTPLPSSFRDPAGFVFEKDGVIYRQVHIAYRNSYDKLMQSGLYARLVAANLLIPHEEMEAGDRSPGVYKILKPKRIPFISYPYEWCFTQLKQAALLTLRIQAEAMEKGMSLKDASAYNIQFLDGRPILIDTLSFEAYEPGKPWIAYRQFCQHFLAPLGLMKYGGLDCGRLSQLHIDGLPLDGARRLLSWRSLLSPLTLVHIHLHSLFQGKSTRAGTAEAKASTPKTLPQGATRQLIAGLKKGISGLRLPDQRTPWSDYYRDTNYSETAFGFKQDAVREWISWAHPGMVWDFGANTGIFSRIAAETGIPVVAFDSDPLAVDIHARAIATDGNKNVLPLVLHLENPSPAIGWDNAERMSLSQRGPVDLILALALIHHLAITHHVSLEMAAAYFARLGKHLILEFIPKTDSQVGRMLAHRGDVFQDYHEDGLHQAFGKYFRILEVKAIPESRRSLYFMQSLIL